MSTSIRIKCAPGPDGTVSANDFTFEAVDHKRGTSVVIESVVAFRMEAGIVEDDQGRKKAAVSVLHLKLLAPQVDMEVGAAQILIDGGAETPRAAAQELELLRARCAGLEDEGRRTVEALAEARRQVAERDREMGELHERHQQTCDRAAELETSVASMAKAMAGESSAEVTTTTETTTTVEVTVEDPPAPAPAAKPAAPATGKRKS